jgi:hypothetical protein
VRTLFLCHRCPLGTPAASQPSLLSGLDAVPKAPCRWGGQGTGAQAAGDRRWPARLQGPSLRDRAGRRYRRRNLCVGSETAQGALGSNLDGLETSTAPKTAPAPGSASPRLVKLHSGPGGGDLRRRLQRGKPGAEGGALSPCGSQ